MHLAGHPYNILTTEEIHLIHDSALKILENVGMVVQNQNLLQTLADFGLQVDFQDERVKFSSSIVERFLSEADKYDWSNHKPFVNSTAGVYHGKFHDPLTGNLLPWSEDRLAYYFKLARSLPNVSAASMLGCRLDVPPALEPLYERFYCWKYGAQEGSSIYQDEILPYLMDLYELRAQQLNKPIQEVFRGTVYLVPPLKLGRHEAYQVDWFRQRGLRVGIGDMYAMGTSAPATLAGAVTLNLAEKIALSILNWVWFGDTHFHLGASIAPTDMRTMVHTFGRPEMAIANALTAQLARHYQATTSGHAALTDAKLPSPEAGMQKAISGAITLLTCGSLWVDAGLLANDEVCSPIQLILDNEMISALKRFCFEFEITEDAIGLETILETGPSNQFMDKEHTAHHYRKEFWQPTIWTRTMLGPWLEAGAKLDVDLAKERAVAQLRAQEPEIFLQDDEESAILKVIRAAEKGLIS